MAAHDALAAGTTTAHAEPLPPPSGPPASAPRADAATLRRLAVQHEVDPRSIQRELRHPGSVRGMAGERARAAAAVLLGASAGEAVRR